MRRYTVLCRLAAASFWALSGVLKLVGFGHERAVPIGEPRSAAHLAATAVELLCAALLLSPRWRAGARLSTVTALVFGAATLIDMAKGASSPGCGCFGSLRLEESMHMPVLICVATLSVSVLAMDGERRIAVSPIDRR
jgi:hypothetical protein